MQLLANNSLENGDHKGLGWIDGTIEKLPNENLKMPHMGWNSIKVLNKNLKINPKKLTIILFIVTILTVKTKKIFWQKQIME